MEEKECERGGYTSNNLKDENTEKKLANPERKPRLKGNSKQLRGGVGGGGGRSQKKGFR